MIFCRQIARLIATVSLAAFIFACNDSSDDNMPAPDTAIDIPRDGADAAGDTASDGDDDSQTDGGGDGESDGQTDVNNDSESDTDEDGQADMSGDADESDSPSDLSTDTDGSGDTMSDSASDMDTVSDGSSDMPDSDMNTTGGCISGATGTHVLRFTWDGSTSGSTAQVFYDANTLPDTSRWKVGAYSMNFNYTPTFQDTFLGQGGLEVSGTVFIDVELSTSGLGNVANATLAIYGRSYNTTSPGSFQWQSFSDVGASAYGAVANSTPYQWYSADATTSLPAGDSGTLLRIEAGPPSGSLIIRSVEICFDAT